MQANSQLTNSDSRAPHAAPLLRQWLANRLSTTDMAWLQSQINKITRANSDRDLHITLGLIPRKLSRDDLKLNDIELRQAHDFANGWKPVGWSIDMAARVFALSHLAESRGHQFAETFADLCRTADLAESIAFYSGLPAYPPCDALNQVIAEGLRSNVNAIFEAIAHHNPYPCKHFSEHSWNHMVLKALFVGSRLSPIVGLDQRANEQLAGILCDFAHERRAAGRPVSYELWRCVGPFATGTRINDLEHVLKTGTQQEQYAALLALSSSNAPSAKQLLHEHPDVADRISRGDVTWSSIAATNTLPE